MFYGRDNYFNSNWHRGYNSFSFIHSPKKMILSGKLKKGERLSYDGIVQDFNVSRGVAHKVISQLKKDGLILSKSRKGSFVV